VEFRVVEVEAREAAALDLTLALSPETDFAVPFWPHASELDTLRTAGATTLTCPTTDRSFIVGQTAMLWRSPVDYELVTLSNVSGDTLTVPAISGTWPAGSIIVPCHRGWRTSEVPVSRLFATHRGASVAFLLDEALFPASATVAGATAIVRTPTLMPDGAQDHRLSLDHDPHVLDSYASWFVVEERTTDARATFAYPTLVLDLADATELWAVQDAMLGACNAAWVPSYAQELPVISIAGSTVTIERIEYTTYGFPRERFRHLALIRAPGVVEHRRVTASSAGAGTETLTLDASITGGTFTPEHHLCALLRYVRMEDDSMAIDWVAPGLGRCDLAFRDLPNETPTSV
jgi:hypothetical protein